MKIDAGSHKSGHNQAHHHLRTKTLRNMAKTSHFVTLLLPDIFIDIKFEFYEAINQSTIKHIITLELNLNQKIRGIPGFSSKTLKVPSV